MGPYQVDVDYHSMHLAELGLCYQRTVRKQLDVQRNWASIKWAWLP